MKLLHTLKTLLEQEEPISRSPWHEQVFDVYSWSELEPISKFFNYDINTIYKELDKLGKGEQFIKHIFTNWDAGDNQMHWIMTALGGHPQYIRGMLDNDLVDKYILTPYIDDIPNLQINEEGRIVLELMHGEQANFFGGENSIGDDCRYVADQIFSDEGLEMEPYDYVPDLTQYIKLITFILKEYGNKVITPWREEFGDWRESDIKEKFLNVTPGQAILTPERIKSFLDYGYRYNLGVLIGNTEELEELEEAINSAYGQAFNDTIMNDYYEGYHEELREFLGNAVGEGTTYTYKNISTSKESKYKNVEVPVKYYDITETAKDLIIKHAVDIDSPQDFLEMLKELEIPLLCPFISENPSHNDVSELFIEYLPDYL